MIKRILLGVLAISILSCASEPKDLTTPSGYKYTHVKTDGEPVKEGDFVSFTIKMVTDDGDVLQEMAEGPNMPVLQMPTAEKPLPQTNPVVEMLMNGAIGDSMTLIMPIDSFPQKNNPRVAGKKYIEYITCIKKTMDEAAYKAEIEALRLEAEKKAEESKARLGEVEELTKGILADYKAGKLDIQKTPEGLEYVIHEPGDGIQAAAGKRASVQYYGAFYDGNMFDSSFKSGRSFTFTLGRGEAIRGWDVGIPLLKQGGKASLFIPYSLAYGEAGRPPSIPEKSDLYFYVELDEVN